MRASVSLDDANRRQSANNDLALRRNVFLLKVERLRLSCSKDSVTKNTTRQAGKSCRLGSKRWHLALAEGLGPRKQSLVSVRLGSAVEITEMRVAKRTFAE